MLNKFEVLLLTPIQVQEFKENFEANNFSIQEALFQSWLQLKAATTPTEQEALTQVLDNHSAKNVQKRKTVRKDKKPDGPSRYDPSSTEWVEILEEKENKKTGPVKRKNEKKQKSIKVKKTAAKKKLRM